MKSNKYILAGFSILFSFALSAQDQLGAIKGQIVNSEGIGEEFAEVWTNDFQGEKILVETNEEGFYELKSLHEGKYNVSATAFGYDTTRMMEVRVQKGEITLLKDLRISGELEIIYHRDLIDKMDPTALKIGAAQLKNNPGIRSPKDLIGNMSSDIKVNENGEIYFRGSRNGSSVYYIDGVKLTGSLANLPGRAYGSVKVYTGGMPAMYGDATGGVVAIETISYFDQYRAKMRSMGR